MAVENGARMHRRLAPKKGSSSAQKMHLLLQSALLQSILVLEILFAQGRCSWVKSQESTCLGVAEFLST